MPRDAQIDYAIKLFALYATPATAYRTMKEEFGDNCFTAPQIAKIRTNHRQEILEKRKELCATIPILDANERWGYLQQIIDGALEGEVIYDKRTGSPIEAKIDRTVALNALKVANDMSVNKGVVNNEDDELIRSIVHQAYDDLKRENPDRDDKDIIEEMVDTLGDKIRPFVSELNVQPQQHVQ